MQRTIQIAIDGPAGAGKSTVARLLAKRLGANYMDTGAMYRALAYALLRQGTDVRESAEVAAALPALDIIVKYIDGAQHVFAQGEDVTGFIRSAEVTKASSDVAVIPAVRSKLVELQRRIAGSYPIVMDGRDIGTVVLPEADAKFFITASAHERALRRMRELGEGADIKKIEADIIARDETDSTRAAAPLRPAADALIIDTTEMSIEQVIDAMLAHISGCADV